MGVTFGTPSKVSRLAVGSEDPRLRSAFLATFTCCSAFLKAFGSGLLCLRHGSGVLHLSLFSGAMTHTFSPLKPSDCINVAMVKVYLMRSIIWSQTVGKYCQIVNSHGAKSDCRQIGAIFLWDFKHSPWDFSWQRASTPQKPSKMWWMQTHENSREITGFPRFFHGSRVVLESPISSKFIHRCTLHPQMQNILQKEATLLRDQLGLQWQDVDWHASPSQYPRMGKFEESNHYLNVRQHVNICNGPVNPWTREVVKPWIRETTLADRCLSSRAWACREDPSCGTEAQSYIFRYIISRTIAAIHGHASLAYIFMYI